MQAWPAGAHGHQMLRREAERRVRGPVLQGAVARATAPGRDGGDRGAERLHRAAARRMQTSHQKPASWRRAPRINQVGCSWLVGWSEQQQGGDRHSGSEDEFVENTLGADDSNSDSEDPDSEGMVEDVAIEDGAGSPCPPPRYNGFLTLAWRGKLSRRVSSESCLVAAKLSDPGRGKTLSQMK